MADETLSPVAETVTTQLDTAPAATGTNQTKKQIALEIDVSGRENWVVCEVCGHKNAQNADLCAMCSNYLF